jgi:hypothetical protein
MEAFKAMPPVTHFLQIVSTSWSLYHLPKQCHQLGTKYSTYESLEGTSHLNHNTLFFNFYFIHMCIHLGHFSSLPSPSPPPSHPHPLPLTPTPSLPSRNYFALISNFVEERI